MTWRLFLCSFLFPLLTFSASTPLPLHSRALLLCLPLTASSNQADLQLFRRKSAAAPWLKVGPPIPVHLGRQGLAWGRGLHSAQRGPQKREGDGKSPAGIFSLGQVLYGYDQSSGLSRWRYRQVTDRDLWIEEPTSSLYNRHLILSAHEPFPPEQHFHLMRQADPAHSLKLFICHNAPPNVQAGAGSAIFFHLCRSADSVTTGCTSMEETAFRELLHSFSPRDQPVYVLLPQEEYQRLKTPWQLP